MDYLKRSRNFLVEIEQKSSHSFNSYCSAPDGFRSEFRKYFGTWPASIFWIIDIYGISLCSTSHNKHPNFIKLFTSACYSKLPIFVLFSKLYKKIAC